MQSIKDFKWHRPPFLLTPYVVREGLFTPETLVAIYNRLKAEGLWDVVFHDNPQMNLLEFMNFFSAPGVVLQIVNVTSGDKIEDMASIAWLSGLEQYGDQTKAIASFCVFKQYQNPVLTDPMAALVFDYWFNALGISIAIGMTPEANKLAVNFVKRIGFTELCRIPKYSYLCGEVTDCVVTFINKENYQARYGG